jgi:predicted RNA-binding Zn ribbon-like protein
VEPGALAAPVESPGVLAAPVESPGVLAVPVAFAAGGGVAFAPTDLVESVLAAAATLTLTGDWGRLKLCPADDCRWAFYDRSRNRSRVWCDMADCGNLAKVRGYRARTAR